MRLSKPSLDLTKVCASQELVGVLTKKQKSGKKIVFTNGCFDVLHVGHVRYLKQAKQLGDVLVIGLNSDRSVRRLKGVSRPLVSQNERAEVLASLGVVDYVVVFSEDTPEKLIRRLKPDVLVKGGDWDKSRIVGAGFVESLGGKVFSLPFVKGRSTSRLLDKIKKL